VSLQLRADVSLTDTDDGMVLLDERSGRYWQLNSSGALVLRRLLDGATPEEVTKTLTTRYPVSQEQAGSDVAALVASLRAAGLVSP
jgi:Coenzyme PQQ synthesis protein D (PqqD)